MTDEKYFCGNTLGMFERSSSAVVETTTGGQFDALFVDNGISVPTPNAIASITTLGDYITTQPFIAAASATTLWTRFDLFVSTVTNPSIWVEFLNSTGVPVLRLTNSNGTITVRYWDGAAFVALGATFSLNTSVLTTWAVKTVCGVSGSVNIWSQGERIFTDPGAGLNAAVNNIAAVRFANPQGSGSPHTCVYSQIMGANFDIRDHHCMPAAIDGEGFYDSDGTGAFTDINETVLDESTALSLPGLTNKRSFTKAALTVPEGYEIATAYGGGRVRVSGGTVTNVKFGFRSGGTNADATPRAAPNGGYEPRAVLPATDPDTSAAWSEAGFNAAELLVEAA